MERRTRAPRKPAAKKPGPRAKPERPAREAVADPAAIDAPIAEIVEALLAWFERVARPLPWRGTRDPYSIWLSEIMAQQTRIDTVIPYFERFVGRYPTVADLAAAELDDVLTLWSGLGYYRRARSLHLAAREVVGTYAGRFPPSAEGLRALPGVGAYTAGAIASMAYDEPAPIVDGNVARVVLRLAAVDAEPDAPAAKRLSWAEAARLVAAAPEGKRGALNEAVMELGATVCRPRKPACGACPIAPHCEARARGVQESIPRAKTRPHKPAQAFVALVLVLGDHVLLARRAGAALFGGLWEPPLLEVASLAEAEARVRALGLEPSLEGPLAARGHVEHVLSHRVFRVTVARAAVRAGAPEHAARLVEAAASLGPLYDAARFVPLARATRAERVTELAMSTLARRVIGAASPG